MLIYVTRLQTSGASQPCGALSADVSHGGNFIVVAQSQGDADDSSLLADSLKMKGGLPAM